MKTADEVANERTQVANKAPAPAKILSDEAEDEDEEAALEMLDWLNASASDPKQPSSTLSACISNLMCCTGSVRFLLLVLIFLPAAAIIILTSIDDMDTYIIVLGATSFYALYIVLKVFTWFLVYVQQVQTDTRTAKIAHHYIQQTLVMKNATRTNIPGTAMKVLPTAGKIPGLFALLMKAAKEDDVDTLKWGFSQNVLTDYSKRDYNGRSLLHWAAMRGSSNAIEFLLSNGAAINLQDRLHCLTPLHYAAYYGHLQCVRILVDKGADLFLTDDRGYVPLQMAETAMLALSTTQPAHQMIVRYVRGWMGEKAPPPIQSLTSGVTVVNLVSRQAQMK